MMTICTIIYIMMITTNSLLSSIHSSIHSFGLRTALRLLCPLLVCNKASWMIFISAPVNSHQLPSDSPFSLIPANDMRCSATTSSPTASAILRICLFLPSIRVNSTFRLLLLLLLLLLPSLVDNESCVLLLLIRFT